MSGGKNNMDKLKNEQKIEDLKEEKRKTDKEYVDTRIKKAKKGDEKAKAELYEYLEKKIRRWAKKMVNDPLYILDAERKRFLEDDLTQAGCMGAMNALARGTYDPSAGFMFETYARDDIFGAMRRERRKYLFSGKAEVINYSYEEYVNGLIESLLSEAEEQKSDTKKQKKELKNNVSEGRRTFQLMFLLKKMTDEDHNISQKKLFALLDLYREKKYGLKGVSENTCKDTLKNMLAELNEEANEKRVICNEKKLTDFSYVHDFSNDELDELIQTVVMSDILTEEMKQKLVSKLMDSASIYYESPFWDIYEKKLKFNPKGIYGRKAVKKAESNLAKSIKVIQDAINNWSQIEFTFNRYNSIGELEPLREQKITPYNLMVYHDKYYCIGFWEDTKKTYHYRVDLMTDVRQAIEDGKPVPMRISTFEGFPYRDASWDPEKYMAEHLYMSYDKPEDVKIKIRKNNYTIIQEWFGNHYKVLKTECNDEYDVIKVRISSGKLLVSWALQYADVVEIMNPDIRVEISKKIKELGKKYGN